MNKACGHNGVGQGCGAALLPLVHPKKQISSLLGMISVWKMDSLVKRSVSAADRSGWLHRRETHQGRK